MKPTLKHTLLGATSALAITVAMPSAVLAQSQSTAATQTMQGQNSERMQNEFSNMIAKLKQAKADLENASKRKVTQISKEVSDDLKKIRSELDGPTSFEKSQAQQLQREVDKALSAFQKPRANSGKLAKTLTPVITEMEKLSQSQSAAMGSRGTNLSSSDNAEQNDPTEQAASTNQTGQKQADIRVKQKAPQVTVSQPAPKVVVQQPSPEVVIKQAKPEVVINQSKPDVKVTQAEPNVTVEQSEKPDVEVRQQGQADVDVKRPGNAAQQDQQAMNEGRNTEARSGDNMNREQNQAESDPAVERIRQMGRTLVGKELYGSNNQNIAEIENVIVNDGKVTAVLVDVGGFLGLGERRVSIPLERLRFVNDRLTTTMTEREVQNLKPYK